MKIKKKLWTVFTFLLLILVINQFTWLSRLTTRNKGLNNTILDNNHRINDLEKENNSMKDKILDLEKKLKEESLNNEKSEVVESPPKESPHDLVRLKDIDSSILEDLKYKTKDNFVNKAVYPESAVAILRRSTGQKLKVANDIFKDHGYRLKVWDGYRPQSIQYILWYHASDKAFVADPDKGSRHNRGAAVDVTLVDASGNEILMGSEFDDFSKWAAYDYEGHNEEASKNMRLLREVMEEAGFIGLSNEWWHFDDKDWNKYDLLDISFDSF